MVKIVPILLIFFSLKLWANSLPHELDQQQSELGTKYMQLVLKYPNVLDLRQGIRNGDHQYIKLAFYEIKSFFKEYDEFNLKKINYVFETILLQAREVARNEILINSKLTTKAQTWLNKMENIYSSYNLAIPYFGTEQDMIRLDIGQQMLPAYGEFVSAILKSRGEKPWRKFGPGKIVPFVDTIPDAFKTSGNFLKLLWASYFRTQTNLQDRAPITEALASTQRKLVRMRQIKTSWDGLENLENLEHDGKTLNMFLINHANSFFDTSAQQSFPVKGLSSMGNVDIFFPEFLAKRMVKSDHIIAVGHGDTTQKAIDLVKNKKLNKFFLAIEGITGVGLYEMRPVMPLFNTSVYDSIKRGLNLKLYPVAFPDNFRLMNDWRSPIDGKKKARGVVLPPLDNEICLKLKEITHSEESIGEFIRWNWFSTLNNSNSEILSMPFPSEILNLIHQMTWEMK